MRAQTFKLNTITTVEKYFLLFLLTPADLSSSEVTIFFRRFFDYWDKVSRGGVSENLSHDEREWLILSNRLISIVVFYFSFVYPAIMLGGLALLLVRKEPHDLILKLVYYFTPVVAFGALIASLNDFIWRKIRHRITQRTKYLLAYMMINLVALTYLANAFLYPKHAPYALQGIVMFPVFFMLRDANRIDKSQVAAFLILFCITVATIYQQFFCDPLIDIPGYFLSWGAPVIYFLAYSTIGVLAFYLRHESSKSKASLEQERQKNAELHLQSEKLLLNILPESIASELKLRGTAEPKLYDSATVLFTDFVGFTKIAEKLTPTELVSELDKCFSYFDNVITKYGLEKLKTIGDAYMAAGGIPDKNNTHGFDCALAAIEIQAFMNQMKNIKEQQGLPYWELRLGMHTGPLVAGVVAERKFAYDVWGDTVNTASRMESSGTPGAINISRELRDTIHFLFECKYRGKVYAKNKGEIEMFYLKGIKPRFSVNGEGRVPNQEFSEIYDRIKHGAKLIRKANN